MNHQHTTELDGFDVVSAQVQASFAEALRLGSNKLYRTNAKDLFATYLAGFSDLVERQHHNCNCCRTFIKRYGNLVAIAEDGTIIPAMWAITPIDVPASFRPAMKALHNAVSKAKITSVFRSKERIWGIPTTAAWNHFFTAPPAAEVFKHAVMTPGQAMAETAQQFSTLLSNVLKYTQSTVTKAVTLLQADQVNRADKFRGPMRAFLLLQVEALNKPVQQTRDAMIWRAIATEHPGFVATINGVLSTLMDDLQAGTGTAAAVAKFNAKTHDLAYQRATVAPKAGNVKVAEDLIAKMNLASALPRRYALRSEVMGVAEWTPGRYPSKPAKRVLAVQAPSVFAGLAASTPSNTPAAPGVIGKNTLTWDKFRRTVLKTAEMIALVVPRQALPYGAITAAADPAAEPLFSWDNPIAPNTRNSFSWYRWHATDADDFGLKVGTSALCLGIAPLPPAWSGATTYEGHILLLEGAVDMNVDKAGTGLFPELLRPELHAVRSTIFAHTSREVLQDLDPANAATGLVIRKGSPINVTLRVTSAGTTIDYTVDRWD